MLSVPYEPNNLIDLSPLILFLEGMLVPKINKEYNFKEILANFNGNNLITWLSMPKDEYIWGSVLRDQSCLDPCNSVAAVGIWVNALK